MSPRIATDFAARVADRRHANHFDLGVEHGVVTARANVLRAAPAVKELANRLVREALGANASREDVAAAAQLVAWAMLGGKTANDKLHGRQRI